jgi:GNAT superfamily N-acetyltransferase
MILMADDADIVIRSATPADREFVLGTTPRLASFGPPPWRQAGEIVAGETRTLETFFASPPQGSALLIAEGAGGQPLGYMYLQSGQDYFTGERHGHVGIIAVALTGEGKGIGHALMLAAERWARSNGYRRLTLNVFEGNARARRVYEHLGYEVETMAYVKFLDAGDASHRGS